MERSTTKFITFTAICSFLGALTTAFLIFVPSVNSQGLEAGAMLHSNTLYLSKLWVLFVHPQVNFIAFLGVAYLLYKKHQLLVILGTLGLSVWAYTEMSQQALLIDALNQFWRPGYLEATSSVDKEMYRTLIIGSSALSDSKYFLVIYSFGLGSLLFGFAFNSESGLGKLISASLIFIGVLSLGSFARFYLGLTQINEVVDWLYQQVYSYLQPAIRVVIGLWLLMKLKKENSTRIEVT
jgi:hypothetical protein